MAKTVPMLTSAPTVTTSATRTPPATTSPRTRTLTDTLALAILVSGNFFPYFVKFSIFELFKVKINLSIHDVTNKYNFLTLFLVQSNIKISNSEFYNS